MPRFSISYTDPVTNEVVLVERNFEADGGHPARYWAEDYAYTVADKGPYTVRELPMTNDVFGALDEPFESEPPKPSKKTAHKRRMAEEYGGVARRLAVVVPSNWTHPTTGETGTAWTQVGMAFETEKGWKLIINENISVTGTVMLLPPKE